MSTLCKPNSLSLRLSASHFIYEASDSLRTQIEVESGLSVFGSHHCSEILFFKYHWIARKSLPAGLAATATNFQLMLCCAILSYATTLLTWEYQQRQTPSDVLPVRNYT